MSVWKNHKEANMARTILALLPLAALLPACIEVETRELSAELPASWASALRVTNGFGAVTVTGVDDLDAVQVRAQGQVPADAGELFTLSEADGVITVEGLVLSGLVTSEVTLELRAPSRLAVELRSLVGDVRVERVSALYLEAGPGALTVREVAGCANLTDGNGDLVVEGIGGDLVLTDGTGDAAICDVAGAVDIVDGNGDLSLCGVVGDAVIVDGTGDLELMGIGGAADVVDGTGDTYLGDVGGDVTLWDGTGEIWVQDVLGGAVIVDGTGDIALYRIGGAVEITDGTGDIITEEVGEVTVTLDGTGEVSAS